VAKEQEMKILVTGAAGYIGDAVIETLLAYKKTTSTVRILAVDNLMYTNAYMRPGVNFKKVDILSDEFFELLDEYKPDSIVHLAAIVGDGACQENPELTVATNEMFVKRLVEAIPETTKLVFASTCSVYGANNDLLDEESETSPLSLYAGTKLNAEAHVKKHKNHTIFRLGTLFGMSTGYARIRADLVANILTFKACENMPLTVFGGDQWRPLVHVIDVARIMATSAMHGERRLGTYILSKGNYRIIDIAEHLKKAFDRELDITITDMKFEDLRNYKVDTKKCEQPGTQPWLTPILSLEWGIQDIIKKYDKIKNPWHIEYHNARYHKEIING
jgi:nucleoside-diphosphate-sugar epimerase